MEKNLYYVEYINEINEDNTFDVILLHFDNDNNIGIVQERFPSSAMTLAGYGMKQISESNYVYYDPSNLDSPFSNGNTSSFARSMNGKKGYLVRKIELASDNVQSEDNVANIDLDSSDNCIAKSFHINIGHGNCSIFVWSDGSVYRMWMVDCCIYDYLQRKDYSQNLEACLDEIALSLHVNKEKLKFQRFMLTHTHYDHYAGVEYLFKKGYVDKTTVFMMNLWYGCSSPSWIRVLDLLVSNKCKVQEPLKSSSNPIYSILYPDVRLKNRHPLQNGARLVTKVNDSSVVYCMKLGGKSMILPGDLEQGGLLQMNSRSLCSPNYFLANYYCISHHGSLTGHVNKLCQGLQIQPRIIDCVRYFLSYAIIMGRDGAFCGIYSPVVLNDFGELVLFSEKDTNGDPAKYLWIDWMKDVKGHR